MSYWIEHGCTGATHDERDWVSRNQDGDPEAFGALVEKQVRSKMRRRSARDSFRFEWRISEAWGRYVERFGLDTPFEVTPPMGMVSANHALHYFRGKLWIAAAGEETVPTPEVNPDLARELKNVRGRQDKLWVYDADSRRVEAAPASLGRNAVTALCAAGDQLWLAGDGVVSFNPGTGQTRRFGIAEGLEVCDTMALASAGGKLFAANARFQIAGPGLGWATLGITQTSGGAVGDWFRGSVGACRSCRQTVFRRRERPALRLDGRDLDPFSRAIGHQLGLLG